MENKQWRKRFEDKFSENTIDPIGRVVFALYWNEAELFEAIVNFVAAELSTARQEERKEIVKLTERMDDTPEMLEMRGKQYTEGFNEARKIIKKFLSTK